ncbi:MAG TPA: arabinan endo-1,5-alpha-L-arabinosidase, partial [Caldilineaceae bacterium]|nr:arabinan endo-1,5-alpha-L-arabinosidase [Caldilineaceae bacterium]
VVSIALLLAACQVIEVEGPETMPPSPTKRSPAQEQLAAMILNTQGDIAPVHDVVMSREGTIYYLFSTGLGIPIRCSDDMVRWRLCGKVFATYPDWVGQAIPGVESLWAPDVLFHEGRYFVYYAASTFGSNRSLIGLASNVTLDPKSEDYEWVDEGEVISSQRSDNYNAIDANLTFDANGQPWLAFGSFWSGIKLVRVDPATLKPAPGAELISIAANPGTTAIEGAYIIRRQGLYYLFISHDYCCRGVESSYKIKVGRSEAITGPYVDRNGKTLMEGGGTLVYDGSERWRGPGHNSVYVENGNYFMVYHAYDASAAGTPTLRIEQLNWDEGGWPLSPSAALGR